ncbi:MAG: hypothetical protein GF331_26080 [Chitinivibrionales bacterium]|nr:hypothetical protein [Chitinivibrionales bacterium]
MEGLTPQTRYYFRVVAHESGEVHASNAVDTVTEEPAGPQLVLAREVTLHSQAHDIALQDHYLFAACKDGMLRIVNIEDPAMSSLVGQCEVYATATDVATQPNYAYVATNGDRVKVVDASDRSSPRIEAQGGTEVSLFILAYGNLMFTGGWPEGLVSSRLVPVSDPMTTITLYTEALDTFPDVLIVEGIIRDSLLFAVDCEYGLRIIDIATPDSLHQIGSIQLPAGHVEVALDGDYAYMASGASGVQVIDVRDPGAPRVVATYDTDGAAAGISIVGNLAFVAIREPNLLVLDITTPTALRLHLNTGLPAASLDVVATASNVYVSCEDSTLRIYGTELLQ